MNILDYIETRMAEGYTEEEAMLLSDELWPISQADRFCEKRGAL